jgi:2-succinyl-6-hydroxy-2,4-cyclohexadiene-1-carboxylate synthase
MGARYLLRLALDRPELVDALVLVGGSPGLDDPADRDARRAADRKLATHLDEVGLDAFLDEWLAQPLFAGLPPELACRDARLQNDAPGLSSSLRWAGTGEMEPLWDRLDELTMPVLVVTGERDEKFSAIARRMADAIGPNAERAVVTGVGHTAHLEDAEGFLALLRPWLAALDLPDPSTERRPSRGDR